MDNSLKYISTGVGQPLKAYRDQAHINGDWTYVHELSLPDTVNRDSYLVALASGKRIIHVGCAAEGATRQQFEKGKLLFDLLETCSSIQLGIDPDKTAVAELTSLVRPRWPVQVCCLNEVSVKVLDEVCPELIFLPEVIEHVPDAGTLLRQVRAIAVRYSSEVVVTVPNALALTAIVAWLDGKESVHPDHVASYTPRTLQTLLGKSGLQPLEIRPYSWGTPLGPNRLGDKLRLFIKSKGNLRARVLSVLHHSLAYKFPDGWIARAR